VGVLNRSVLVVIPRQPFLDWLHRADPTSGDLTLEDLRRDPSVYLLPARDLEPDLEKCLKRFCKAIFEEQLDGWYRVKELWPRDRSITAFKEWFEYRFHSMPIDLAREPLVWEEL
jgi:hypothetical protein